MKKSYEYFSDFNEDKIVFGYNNYLSGTTIDRRNRSYALNSGLPSIRIHDFRYSHATYLIHIMQGRYSKEFIAMKIAQRLGHSNVMITLKTYSHLYNKTDKDLVGNR